MAQAVIKLTKGTTVVALPGPGPEGTRVTAPTRFVTGATVGGVRFGYKASASTREIWSIPLTRINGADKLALQQFFYADVGGPGVSFSYQHTDGTSYTASFTESGLRWNRRNGNQWDITLVLEVTSEVQ